MQRAEFTLRPNRLAIVGFAFRFPGPEGDAFWAALCEGRNLVTTVHPSRWSRETYYHPRRNEPGSSYTLAGGSLGDVRGFDAAFFGISPREAAALDPQQRLLLELSWEAFESAGIPPSSVRGSRGSVHIGFSGSDYGNRGLDDLSAADSFTMTGVVGSIAANRLSYFYDLRGPSMAVDTACSSSLVALHQACQSLILGESELAIAGAVNLHLHPLPYVAFSKASMLSRRGVCSPFDAEGDGYVRSEGGAIVLLKRFEDALAAGNVIHGVVAGTNVNCDGKTTSLTVPSCEAQSALLTEAYSRACIDPAEIDYLEAHGTGTAVGDPIEARALGEALGKRRSAPLPIGSVKSNLGHLETASGMAGLVKALYCVRSRVVPPSINFHRPNPNIPFGEWNLEVVTEPKPLDPAKRIVVGVNSFGFGGANAHAILESHLAPAPAQTQADLPAPFVVSARSEAALKEVARRAAEWLATREDLGYYDLAYTAAFHRDWLEHRAIAFGADRKAVAQALESFAKGNSAASVSTGRALAGAQGPAFVYSGNGSQWAGMGKRLLGESEVFAAAVQKVDALWRRHSGFSLLEAMRRDDVAELLEATEYAQPLLFALQVGLTELLRDWGLEPLAVAGHSVGEIAAAWACEALTLEQATQVVYHRSSGQAKTRGAGSMCAVSLPESEARALLADYPSLALAAVNSPRGVTIAGPAEALDALEARLARLSIGFRRLKLDYAFHSAAMDGIEGEIRASLAGLRGAHERVPYYSTVTGELLAGESLDAGYWWRNIREPVRFAAAIERLAQSRISVFVEIGPNPALRGYIGECLAKLGAEGRVLATMTRSGEGLDALREKAFQALVAGCETDLARLFPEKGRQVELPRYPWQREPHWYKPTAEGYDLINRRRVHPLLGSRLPASEGEWESHLDTDLLPVLADHRVGGQVVVPAAAFAEMALAAAADAQPGECYELEELEIRAPLILDEGRTKTVRFALDAADRRFAIKSRERLSREPWRLHVVGKLSTITAGDTSSLPRAPAPQAAEPASGAAHYQRTSAVGLDYGPAFRQVAEVWRDGEVVCARLHGGDRGDASALLPTRSFDAAFQLLVHAFDEIAARGDIAFVPVKVERLVLQQPQGEPRWARLEMRRRGPRSVLADCVLYDGDRQAVAALHGVRFRAVPLRRAAAPITYLEASLVEQAPLATPLERLAEVCRARLHDARRLQARERYFNDLEPLLEAMLAAFAKEALAGVAPDRQSSRVAALLAEAAGEESYPPAREIWRQLLGDHPDHAAEVIWLGRIGLHLPELLAGRGWSGPSLVPSSEFTQAIADAVAETLRTLQSGKRLRVAWLDAGHSPALARTLDRLDPQRCDCLVLCAEPRALEDRKVLATRYSGTLVRAIDFSGDEPPLGTHETEPYDLVILEDGLGWTEDPHAVLRVLRRLAADGGVLMLGEQRPSRAAVLAGRILAAAGVGTSLKVAREAAQWPALLAEHGFVGTMAIPDLPEIESCCELVLTRAATRPAAAAVANGQRWLVVARPHGPSADIGSRVAALLRIAGATVEVSSDAACLEQSDAVVYLGGLGVAAEAQAECCSRLGALLEAAAACAEPPAVTVVTAASHRHPDEALLWGFARVAINEYRQLALRLVDLAEPGEPDAMARALTRRLLAPSPEDEVILASSGVLATRVQPVLAPASAAPEGAQNVRLEIPPGGQLRSLAWVPQPERAVGEDEVEIDVRAAGVNFRDVMFAMGHLTDEAMENGFVGPTLGMELSGVVRAIGRGVHGLRAGYEVIAFAPASFATRVVTSASAVVKKPADWSFEAAATIPATFLTAYYALHDLARLEEGQRILIHGAAGGVGLAAIQLAQMAGAEVFATASEGKRDVLRLFGVEHVLDSRSLSFASEVMDLTRGEGVDVVLNSLAGEAMMRSLGVLKPFGRFLELGKRDFCENTRIGLRPLRNNISYFGIDADQLMGERPELARRLMQELMALFRGGRLKPLPYRAFAACEALDAFRYMQQSRQIGKIVLTLDPAPAAAPAQKTVDEKLELKPDATYLVTGGLRGFGLATAHWLADKGARSLALVGRTGAADAEAQQALAALEARGVRVLCAACDVADRASVEHLLREVRSTMPPLRGVVHAAAVISDSLIRNLKAEQIEAVFAPKAYGARHLHELTRADALDFFVLYSSATTLFGNPGQASYVAANRYLEVLAEARRAEGRPALCVSWGPIGDAGYLARHPQIREALEMRMGGSTLSAAEALALLEQWLVRGDGRHAVVKFDRGGPARMLSGVASPKFGTLLGRFEGGEPTSTDSENLQRLLQELDDDALATLFTDIVKKEIAEILRMSADKLEADRPLQDLGLDSLMGVELMTAVESRFGVSIPVMAMTEVGTIEKLVARIVKELRRREAGGAGGGEAAEVERVAEHVRHVAAQHAAGEVAQSEIDAFANEMKVTAK